MAEKFDKGKIADLVAQIDQQLVIVSELRGRHEKLRYELNAEESRLANLRIEFTRAVDGHLDMSTLKQRAPERLPV